MSTAMHMQMKPGSLSYPPQARVIGRFNWLGLGTLYAKEVRRFLKVYTQTLLAPVVTTLLFLAIFALALGGRDRQIAGLDYVDFLAPGLIMMTMMQNAFANTSSSLVIAKVQGNIVDLLMPPLSPLEMTLGVVGGGVTRGLLVSLSAGLAMWIFVPLRITDPLLVLYFAFSGSLMLSLLGVVGGIWSEKFDHIAAVTNFVITPFSFLSGTFYTVDRLPEDWQALAYANPFFYLIDGFRSGFIGRGEQDAWIGILVVGLVNLALLILSHQMFARGYRLRP